ncbi:hypothetical protein OAG29_02230 [Planctomycetaceae bacterium]|nr:hypothetical protein [Planctomycetaceae bacterium]
MSKEKDIGTPSECPDCEEQFTVSKQFLEQIKQESIRLNEQREEQPQRRRQREQAMRDLSDPHEEWRRGLAPLSGRVIGACIIGTSGVLMLLFFAFGYDTAPEGVHNIGLLNNRTNGLIVGVALITWAIIMGRK